MSGATDAQGGQVLNLGVPGSPGGLSEIWYTIKQTGVGTVEMQTNRPDLLTGATNTGPGIYKLAVNNLPEHVRHLVSLRRAPVSLVRYVAATTDDTLGVASSEVKFTTSNAAGAVLSLETNDKVHGSIQFARNADDT